MTIGVKFEMRVYAEDRARPANASTVWASIKEPVNISNVVSKREDLSKQSGGWHPGNRKELYGGRRHQHL